MSSSPALPASQRRPLRPPVCAATILPLMSGVIAMEGDWPSKVERRIVALETRNAVEEVHRLNVTARLSAIEDTLKWLVRLIGGGLLMGGLAYVLQGGLAI